MGAPAGWANNIVTSGGSLYVFRAENVDDYTTGYFSQIMADPGAQTQAITLVETNTESSTGVAMGIGVLF